MGLTRQHDSTYTASATVRITVLTNVCLLHAINFESVHSVASFPGKEPIHGIKATYIL